MLRSTACFKAKTQFLGNTTKRLYRIAYVPIRYHVKIKGEANPFLPEFDKYFVYRTKRREQLAKECRQITTFIDNNNRSSDNSRVFPHRNGLKSA